MNDVQVTLVGYVGTDIDYRDGNGTGARATFRVGSTSRFFDRNQGTWRDQETVWTTVKVWRSLAQNVSSSVRKGEPVIVTGKLRAESWRDEHGEQRRREVLEATSVGHDLSRGTSAYLRTSPARVERSDNSVDAGVHARPERHSESLSEQPGIERPAAAGGPAERLGSKPWPITSSRCAGCARRTATRSSSTASP